jgi:cellulose synthase/poly-beta-1,6-N-acetylglucosamine synthase-like glycosyltransferase
MTFLELLFWIPLAGVLYAYVGYPLSILLAAKVFGQQTNRSGSLPQSVSIILAVHNEESCLVSRIRELTHHLDNLNLPGELIIVSDGSTDNTLAIARDNATPIIQVLEQETNEGKAAALNLGCATATGEVLVFADARQTWDKNALSHLIENFRDPAIGAVSGNLLLESPPGTLTGVGAYWRFEKWIRTQESHLHSLIGATGAISACRSTLFKPIPKGTLLDDVYWPLQVAMQRYRVVHEPKAIAHDRLPLTPLGEFHRKLRTLSGVFQLLALCPQAWIPWRNPIWFQLLSHKMLRLLVPWALLLILATSILLAGPFYRIALLIQLGLYLLGALGLLPNPRNRLSLTQAAASFMMLNSAAWLAFWIWLLGASDRTWRKTPYSNRSLEYTSTFN